MPESEFIHVVFFSLCEVSYMDKPQRARLAMYLLKISIKFRIKFTWIIPKNSNIHAKIKKSQYFQRVKIEKRYLSTCIFQKIVKICTWQIQKFANIHVLLIFTYKNI